MATPAITNAFSTGCPTARSFGGVCTIPIRETETDALDGASLLECWIWPVLSSQLALNLWDVARSRRTGWPVPASRIADRSAEYQVLSVDSGALIESP